MIPAEALALQPGALLRIFVEGENEYFIVTEIDQKQGMLELRAASPGATITGFELSPWGYTMSCCERIA